MRKFDIRHNGVPIAWSLDIRGVFDQLLKLADDKYEVWDKDHKKLAYTVLPGWRTFTLSNIVDENTLQTMNFNTWAEHEYSEYGM